MAAEVHPPVVPVWDWPFTRSDLTAGLRRYFADTSIHVTEVAAQSVPFQRPSIGRVRGIKVSYSSASEGGPISLVVKEPRGTTRAGLAGAGRREVGVYRSLAPHLPLRTPALIAASPTGDWMILEAIRPLRRPEKWRPEDYWQAIEGLCRLHDRFWDLGEDLGAFPWLGRPLEADFEVHVTAAAQAIQRIVDGGQPVSLARTPERMQVLARLTTEADRIGEPLRAQPHTLLHGDYWPGNIAAVKEHGQVVYDWQMTAVGPAIMDLLVFISKSEWWFGELPVPAKDIVARYRAVLAEKTGRAWDDEEWARLWDHALMWRFLQEWVDLLAASPDALLEARTDLLDEIWLDPVTRAVARRLGRV